MLVVVYVGAVAVLFLFVVMMLDVNFVRLREGFLQYLPIGALIGLVLLVERSWSPALGIGRQSRGAAIRRRRRARSTNTAGARPLLYTRYFYMFQVAGVVLLVAMIGAIVLTLRRAAGRACASTSAMQVHRQRRASVELRKVPTREAASDERSASRSLPHRGRGAVHARRLRHLPEPQERHHHPDVVELMLLAVNINLVAFSAYLGDLAGQIFAMFVLTVAAAEAAIGLAIWSSISATAAASRSRTSSDEGLTVLR